jgi:flagellar biosynthetic protein FliP
VGVALFLGALTLLPSFVLVMTSFLRIVVVLGFLRSALGTQTSPPTQLLIILALVMTGIVMQPTLTEVTNEAITPYLNGQVDQVAAYERGIVPLRRFMLANVRPQDVALFAELGRVTPGTPPESLPLATIVGAFMTSELRTAFLMGFLLYLPFMVVDLLVASSLMSLGMFMLPPVMVSLPFKLLLFVMADGWTLLVKSLVMSFKAG